MNKVILIVMALTLLVGFSLTANNELEASKSPINLVTIMGPVMQGMIVVTDVTGIYLSQEKDLNFIQRGSSTVTLMASAIVAFRDEVVMLMKRRLIAPNHARIYLGSPIASLVTQLSICYPRRNMTQCFSSTNSLIIC
jgi:hypothetical protein